MQALGRISNLGGQFVVRRAVADDVAEIVALIAADQIGQDRDGGDLVPYTKAFTAIEGIQPSCLSLSPTPPERWSARCSSLSFPG